MCSPRLVTTTTCPRALRHRVIEGPRRERRADHAASRRRRRTRCRAGACPGGSRRGRSGGSSLAAPDGRDRAADPRDLEVPRDQVDRPAPYRSARPIRRRIRDEPLAGTVRPTSRLPIGSKVGCAAVSRGSENASVSRTRDVQRLRARPMKSIREVRKPSGGDRPTPAGPSPWRACPRRARREGRGVLHLGEQPVVLRVAPVGLGAIEHPFQVRHDLEPIAPCPPGSPRVIVHSSDGIVRSPGSVMSTVVRSPSGEVRRSSATRPSARTARSGSDAPGQRCRSTARRAADRRPSGCIDQEERPAGGVEEVVGAAAHVVHRAVDPADDLAVVSEPTS